MNKIEVPGKLKKTAGKSLGGWRSDGAPND
jgi:hypothetical protein